jgi:hypothetical protein
LDVINAGVEELFHEMKLAKLDIDLRIKVKLVSLKKHLQGRMQEFIVPKYSEPTSLETVQPLSLFGLVLILLEMNAKIP